MRKAYWITCNVEPDIQHLFLNRRRFPGSIEVRHRDLNRLLDNFQSSLQVITVIATADAASELGGKTVELRSHIDPTKAEEALDSRCAIWCEGIEAKYKNRNRSILMAPIFGLDDGSSSNFDAALVLATMLISQFHDGNSSEVRTSTRSAASSGSGTDERQAQGERNMNATEQRERQKINADENELCSVNSTVR
ncbi:hypothetical protein P3X46_034953, partial [Hevea brasiliensis]